MESSSSSGGIKLHQIENHDQYKSIIKNMLCCICLEVVCKPEECINCQSLICDHCFKILEIAGKKCMTPKCKGSFRKANKFVREILSNLKIKCDWCSESSLIYPDYISHLDKCFGYQNSGIVKLLKTIQEKEDKITEYTKEIDSSKTTSNSLNSLLIRKDPYAHLTKDALRTTLMTFSLPNSSKMELYNSCVEGKLEEFRNCVLVKKSPILEEVSAHNYFWTPFHYAMHYGQWEIIKFIAEQLRLANKLDSALRIESNDGRCPLLCLLRSNSIILDKKSEIIKNLLSMYPNINFSEGVKKEIKSRGLESVVKKYQKNF